MHVNLFLLEGEFDFSQSSSDVRGDPGMIVYVNKSLNSTKSSKDKKPSNLNHVKFFCFNTQN
jgi:hypothetical protein